MQFNSDGQIALDKFGDCQAIAAELGRALVDRAEGKDIPVEMTTAIAIMIAARAMVATVAAHGASLRSRDLRPLIREYGKFLETMCLDTAATLRRVSDTAGHA